MRFRCPLSKDSQSVTNEFWQKGLRSLDSWPPERSVSTASSHLGLVVEAATLGESTNGSDSMAWALFRGFASKESDLTQESSHLRGNLALRLGVYPVDPANHPGEARRCFNYS